MLDRQTRSFKDVILRPLVQLFRFFTPTQLSLIGFVLGIAATICLARQLYFWGMFLWILNRIFDGLDGIVARETNQQSDLGGYIDILCDFFIYAAIPIGLVYGVDSADTHYPLIFLFATFYLNAASWIYLAAILEKRNLGAQAQGETTSITMPNGIVGGFVTILFYCTFILWPQQLAIGFVIMGLLILLGVVQRLLWAISHLPPSQNKKG